MWYFHSLTRDQTHDPALEAPSCNHWTAREVRKITALEWEEKQE